MNRSWEALKKDTNKSPATCVKLFTCLIFPNLSFVRMLCSSLPLTVVVAEQRLSFYTEKNVKSLFGEIRSYRIEFLIISFAVIYYSLFRQRRSIQKAIIFLWNSLLYSRCCVFFFSCPVKIILLYVSFFSIQIQLRSFFFVSFTLFFCFCRRVFKWLLLALEQNVSIRDSEWAKKFENLKSEIFSKI